MTEWLDAAEATRLLGVSAPTLYAYVSRGIVHSQAGKPGDRHRLYAAGDVRRLLQRKEARRDPSRVLHEALHLGAPLLDSAITLIDDGQLFYRGVDATQLARTASVEEVASLIWTGETSNAEALFRGVASRIPKFPDLPLIAAMQLAIAVIGSGDPSAFDLRASAVTAHGARILRILTAITAGAPRTSDQGAAAQLAQRWNVPAATGIVSSALILCADHELNISSFTARCAASAGSSPYQVVLAGLAAVQGVRHGGLSTRVSALFGEVGSPKKASAVIASRLQRGDPLPGFGSQLYPAGDPRGAALLEIARRARPRARQWALIDAIQRAAFDAIQERPTIDFALVSMERILGLPNGSALTLFALGRTIGWIGHAIEQYAIPGTIRPRARYVGRMPATT